MTPSARDRTRETVAGGSSTSRAPSHAQCREQCPAGAPPFCGQKCSSFASSFDCAIGNLDACRNYM
eukprot:2626144-Pyramimonas_sp.AAC.1